MTRSPFVRRRACEALIRAGFEPPVDASEPLLADGDRFVRTAARLVLQRDRPEEMGRRSARQRQRHDLAGMEAIIALCKAEKAAPYAGSDLRPAAPSVARRRRDVAAELSADREMALIHCPPPRSGCVRRHRRGPARDVPASGRAGQSRTGDPAHGLAARRLLDEPVQAKLLAALLASAGDRPQQIHYFYCLRLLHDGWTAEQKDEPPRPGTNRPARGAGGHSFTPFLENILRDWTPS